MFNEKTLPSAVTDIKALATLKAYGFQHERSDGMYSDYERPMDGYGEDGTDRHERLTFIVESQSWYPSAEHIDLMGNEWYHESGVATTLDEAIQWLMKDARKAPKKKV